MRNIKITRVSNTSYETENEGACAPWLKKFITANVPKQETIVEQSRQRNVKANYLDKLQNILQNRPRYATVEDAVKDLRKRTGLEDYLKRINSEETNNKIEKKASLNIKARIEKIKDILKKKANDIKIPETIAKHGDVATDIVAFINNKIEDAHGLGVTIPQLQQDIIEVFGPRHGVSDKDVYNDDVAKFISDSISRISSFHGGYSPTPTIGKGLGQDIDSGENNDAWSILMPQKG